MHVANVSIANPTLEAAQSVVNLHELVKQLLESNVQLNQRLRQLEDTLGARCFLPPGHNGDRASTLHIPTGDAASVLSVEDSMTDVMSVLSRRRGVDFDLLRSLPSEPINFVFEEELMSSRVSAEHNSTQSTVPR